MGSRKRFTGSQVVDWKSKIMKKLFILAALIATISAKATPGPDYAAAPDNVNNFNNLNTVKEREYSDSYGAPQGPVLDSGSSWGNADSFDSSFTSSGLSGYPTSSNNFGTRRICHEFTHLNVGIFGHP